MRHNDVKARPILFSGAMIRALLAGTKTQTRRIVKPWTKYVERAAWECRVVGGGFELALVGAERGHPLRCPYGRRGDYLWVRERAACYWGGWHYHADGPLKWGKDVSETTFRRPSIHMPRVASRITLRINDVRVERLQEISVSDAIDEGIDFTLNDEELEAVPRYRDLWEQINGVDSWSANPWIWALTFEVITQNVDAVMEAARAA